MPRGKRFREITDVRVRRTRSEGKLKGVASITFDESFVVHDLKVIDGEKGFFVAMPSRKVAEGEYRDIAHPLNRETRERIEKAVLRAYADVLQKEDE